MYNNRSDSAPCRSRWRPSRSQHSIPKRGFVLIEETDPIQAASRNRSGRRRPAAQARQERELTGKMLEFTLSTRPRDSKPPVAPRRAGKAEQWSSAALARSLCISSLSEGSVRQELRSLCSRSNATEENAQAIAEAHSRQFESDKYKTDRKNDKNIESASLLAFQCGTRCGDKGLSKGRIIADAQNFARTSSTSLPTNSRRASSPKRPKPWPRGPASPSKSSTKKRLPASRWRAP